MSIELSNEHMRLFKKFKSCVDSYSIAKMDKKLYDFFYLHCDFIAHYNIHGFRAEYSGERFLNWFKVFTEPSWMFFLPHDDEYLDLKKACVHYAQEKAEDVYAHFARLERNRKIQELRSLSKELGIPLGESGNADAEYCFLEEEDGQLSLFA